ncbi:MAG TPA: ferric reductase-like transmembrane domain-containing protein [Ornithinibacter sp.]|nr:ferric reductase-like transmembrane domain-containing protein [Ornithinibacter sp.]
MTSPLLWYVNRGTGVVLLVVFSLAVVLGVLATGRGVSPLWPRFVTQGLHRTLAGLSVLLLTAHAASAVVDEYVDIRWWQAFSPVGATYEPLWLGLGTLALDLTLVVVATSLARARLPHRTWFLVHLTTYAAWAAGVAHGIGIGTDAGRGWLAATTAGCVAAVALAVLARLVAVARGRGGDGSVGGVDDLFPAATGGTR